MQKSTSSTPQNHHDATVPPMDCEPITEAHLRFGGMEVAGTMIGLFTQRGDRTPSKPTKTKHIRLISIVCSHYVEKVRWALEILEQDDQSPVYYTEDCHPPYSYAFQTVSVSNNQASQTPMIVMDDGKALWKSDQILLEITPHLYPKAIKEEVVKMEHDLNYRVGSAFRCIGFHHLLGDSDKYYPALIKFGTAYCTQIETFLYDRMFDLGIDKGLRKRMEINQDTCDVSEAEIRKVFAELSERLEVNGGEYIMDTPTKKYGFTVVDLTFAALSFHFLQPPQMEALVVPRDDAPTHLVNLADELRATTAGKHALHIYEKHRPVSETSKKVMVHTYDHRDRMTVQCASN